MWGRHLWQKFQLKRTSHTRLAKFSSSKPQGLLSEADEDLHAFTARAESASSGLSAEEWDSDPMLQEMEPALGLLTVETEQEFFQMPAKSQAPSCRTEFSF